MSNTMTPAIRLSRVLVATGRIRKAAHDLVEEAYESAAALESLGYGAVADELDASLSKLLDISDEIEKSARATTSPTQASLVLA